jgi:hypothetical protein
MKKGPPLRAKVGFDNQLMLFNLDIKLIILFMMVQGQCKPNAIEFTRNSCLGKRFLRRRVAELQPVLVFEDKGRDNL